MSNTLTTNQQDKIKNKFLSSLILGGILITAGYYLFPYLKEIIWNAVNIAIGAVALGLVLSVLLNKNLWRRLGYLIDAMSNKIVNATLNVDNFYLQDQQIKNAEDDLVKMHRERINLEGKYIELSSEINNNIDNYNLAAQSAILAEKEGDLELAERMHQKALGHEHYINTIKPIAEDIKFTSEYMDEMYKTLKQKVSTAKSDLNISKDVFYSIQQGNKAINSANNVLVGDVDLNRDAEESKKRIKAKVANSISNMKVSMQLLSQVAKDDKIENRAKLEVAKIKLKELDGDFTKKYNKIENSITSSNKKLEGNKLNKIEIKEIEKNKIAI